MKTIELKQDSYSSTSGRISFLDSLRAIAIIMVVGVHTLGYCVLLPPGQKVTLLFIVHTISVPVFFLVDGYLFARSVIHARRYSYPQYVRKSLFRLLLPWVIFTLTYTISRYGFEIFGVLREKLILEHSLQDIAISAYGSVYAPQMYFLLSLFFIRLCTPLFEKFVAVRNVYILLFLLFCYCAFYKSAADGIYSYLKIEGGQEPIMLALWGIQFYCLGIICFKISGFIDLKNLFMPVLLLFLLSLLIKNKLNYYSFDLVQKLYLLTVVFFFALFRDGFYILNIIGKNTMGIYLIHTPIVLKGVSLLLNGLEMYPLLEFLLVLIVTFLVTIVIVMIINLVPYGCLLFGIPYQQNNILLPSKRLKQA